MQIFLCYLVLFVLSGSGYKQSINCSQWSEQADSSLKSFLSNFWNDTSNYLNSQYPSNGIPTGYWTFAQGFDALLDGIERTKGTAFNQSRISEFVNAQNEIGWFRNW